MSVVWPPSEIEASETSSVTRGTSLSRTASVTDRGVPTDAPWALRISTTTDSSSVSASSEAESVVWTVVWPAAIVSVVGSSETSPAPAVLPDPNPTVTVTAPAVEPARVTVIGTDPPSSTPVAADEIETDWAFAAPPTRATRASAEATRSARRRGDNDVM